MSALMEKVQSPQFFHVVGGHLNCLQAPLFGFSVNLFLNWIKMDKPETTSSSALSTREKEWEEIMLFLQLAFICK